MSDRLQRFFNQVWYGDRAAVACSLQPLAVLVKHITERKRRRYLAGNVGVFRAAIPVIVVGNITVGGTGKTPLVISLVQALLAHGFRPGIVSRGYGGRAPYYPYLIQPGDVASVCGDEPLLLFQRTGVPVVVDPRRAEAARVLQEQTDCDVIVSDDGLQHYALGRTYEIVVLDGGRGIGNARLLPAGPLREPVERLRSVNALVINGVAIHDSFTRLPHQHCYNMSLEPAAFQGLQDNVSLDLAQIHARSDWVAVAGIGNPERFFQTLDGLGIRFQRAPFPDHHAYSMRDFTKFGDAPLLTTEKDAVKLRCLPLRGAYLPIEARIQPPLIDDIIQTVKRFQVQSHHLY